MQLNTPSPFMRPDLGLGAMMAWNGAVSDRKELRWGWPLTPSNPAAVRRPSTISVDML